MVREFGDLFASATIVTDLLLATVIISHLFPRQPAGQSNPRCNLAEFALPFQSHSNSLLLQ